MDLPPARGPAHAELPPPVVMVSKLELASFRDLPSFLRAALDLRRSFRTAPGAGELRLSAQPARRTFWTWSTWADDGSLAGYTRSPEHVRVVRQFAGRLAHSRFVTLHRGRDVEPRSWAEVRDVLGAGSAGGASTTRAGHPEG